MNKRITLLVLVVVLAAMGLVFFSHMRAPTDAPAPGARQDRQDSGAASVGRDGRIVPQQSGQTDNGLMPVEPPVGDLSGRDGAPRPVTLTPGPDPRSMRVVGGAGQPEDNATAQAPAADAPQAAPPGRTPSLTPWELPPLDDKKRDPRPAAAPETQTRTSKPKASETAREPALSDKGAHNLKNIALQFAGQSMKLHIEADDPFPVKTFVLTGPDRLVIDLPGTWKGMKVPAVPQNKVIKDVRLGRQPAGPRLVLDLASPIRNHTVRRSQNSVEVLLQ